MASAALTSNESIARRTISDADVPRFAAIRSKRLTIATDTLDFYAGYFRDPDGNKLNFFCLR